MAMFKLTLFDRNGTALKMGDIVKVSNGTGFQFYSEVKYLEDLKCIAPFHTFTFHSFVKVDKVPENAKLGKEERYKIWYISDRVDDDPAEVHEAERYLSDWRDCEHLLEQRCYRIELLKE
jgi:hypothetical protein